MCRYYKGNERSQRLPQLWWKNRQFLQSCTVIELRPYVFEAEIRLWHWKWCLYPSSRVSIDLVTITRKASVTILPVLDPLMHVLCLDWGPEGLTRWCNSDRRQDEWAIWVLERCPVTDVGPTVQPEVETGVSVKPSTTHQIDPQGKQRVYIACKKKVSEVPRGYCKRTYSHRVVKCRRDQRPRWNKQLIIT